MCFHFQMLQGRMDTGVSYIPLKTELSRLPPIVSATDLVDFVDQYVGREGCWHTGSYPVQTFLSCLYIEDLLTHYIGIHNGPAFVDAIVQELFKRLSLAKKGLRPSTLTPTNAASDSSSESFSKGPARNIVFNILDSDIEELTAVRVEISNFLSTLPLYELLTIAYLVASIKTVDLCLKHYEGAKDFIFPDEDIGLTLNDFRLLDDVISSKIRMILVAAFQILQFELQEVEKEQEEGIETTSSNASQRGSKKGVGKSKAKAKPNDDKQTKKKQFKGAEAIRQLIARFKLRSSIIDILDELPILPDSKKFRDITTLINEILQSLPLSQAYLKPAPLSSVPTPFTAPNTASDAIKSTADVFSCGIQSRANNNTPFRELATLSPTDGYTVWKSIVLTIDTFHFLTSMAGNTEHPRAAAIPGSPVQPKTAGNLRFFFVSFGGSKPTLPITPTPYPTQPLPLTRAVLHNVTFNPVKGEILGEPAIEWVLRDIREVSGSPLLRVLLNNTHSINTKNEQKTAGILNDEDAIPILEAVSPIRNSIDTFLVETATAFIELLFSFVCNRARQRQMLSHSIILWDSLEVGAQNLDHIIHSALDKAGEPVNTFTTYQQIPDQISSLTGISQPMPEVQQAYPLMWWASARRMLTILWVILMGFELDVYKPWEHGYMYDYAEEVETEILSCISVIKLYHADALAQREAGAIDSSKTTPVTAIETVKYAAPLGKRYLHGDPKTVFLDISVSDQYISNIQYEQHMMKDICESQRKLAEAAIMLGYVTRPESITRYTPARLLYQLRMKPFSSIGYPAPPKMDFEDRKDDLSPEYAALRKASANIKDNQRGLFRLRPDDMEIATPARVKQRLKGSRAQSSAISKQLSGMIPPSLANSISTLITSTSVTTSASKPVLLSSNNPTALSLIDCVSNAAASEQMLRLKNSVDKITQAADRLEKHLKSAGGFKNRKTFNVKIVKDGTHPWFPVMEFERK